MLTAGLCAFPITPADPAGRVDTDGLDRLVDRIAQSNADAVGLLGSTGTYAYLTRSERMRAITATIKAASGWIPILVGVGALRTHEACALAQDAAQDAAQAGAADVLRAPVSDTPLTDQEVAEHFRAVARPTDLPLCIYDAPATTGFDFSRRLLAELAQERRIAGVKMPLPADGNIRQQISALRTALPQDCALGYSGDWGCAQAMLDSADIWFNVPGGLFPDIRAALTQAARARSCHWKLRSAQKSKRRRRDFRDPSCRHLDSSG
ncbi:MAG: dihydrodipicolinate synthase family protein [Roseinatronobacter sp.]